MLGRRCKGDLEGLGSDGGCDVLEANEDIFQGSGVISWVKSKLISPCKTSNY